MVRRVGHLRVEVDDQPGRTVVAIAGEIDLHTSPEVRAHVGRAARDGKELVIDLREVEFLDSTGLGSLVWARKMVRRGGGDIRVVGPRPHVRRVLEISGVSEIVPVEGCPPPES